MICIQAMSNSGNVLSFTPPGFKQTLHVKFPDSRLAVCEKCKKNYKTREMCRVRNNHTDAPWSTAYICITLDESCTDANNKLVDKPYFVKMNQWHPYCAKKSFDARTPVCAACKKTNRTRSFCRERHQHKQLPWCAVYVILTCKKEGDENDKDEAEGKGNSDQTEKTDTAADNEAKDNVEKNNSVTSNSGEAVVKTEGQNDVEVKKETDEENKTKAVKSESSAENNDDREQTKSVGTDSSVGNGLTESKLESGSDMTKEITNGSNFDSDDINNIDESRTFLAQVSCSASSIQWLELAEYDQMKNSPFVFANGQTFGASNRSPLGINTMAAVNHPYYPPMVPIPGFAHPQALQMQQQHFLQMQQRHQAQFVAQQAALQAQYNQQFQMAMATGQQAAGTNLVGAPQGQAMPTPTADMQQTAQDSNPQPPAQMNMHQNGGTQTDVNSKAQNDQDAAQQQAQFQAQWQAQMLYQQQLYQQQLHMQQQGNPLLMQQPSAIMTQQFVQQTPQFPPIQQFPQVQLPRQIPPSQNPQMEQISTDTQPNNVNVNVNVMGNQALPTEDEDQKRKQSEMNNAERREKSYNETVESNKKPKS